MDQISNDEFKIPTYENITEAKVIKVYDGDTVTIGICNNNKLEKHSMRLYGIDTAEIKGGNETTKELAKAAKKVVSDLILDKVVKVKILNGTKYNGKLVVEKYGRLIGFIYIDNKSIADILLELDLAKKYDGGKKEVF